MPLGKKPLGRKILGYELGIIGLVGVGRLGVDGRRLTVNGRQKNANKEMNARHTRGRYAPFGIKN